MNETRMHFYPKALGVDVIKKWTALLLAMLLLLLAACGKKGQAASQGGSSLPDIPEGTSPAGVSSASVSALTFDPLADTGANVLTGLARAEGWASMRPAAVVISNSFRGRPQRGLHMADVLVEMLAEGNTTHLLALFDNYSAISTTGPVAETFDQFVQFALPLNAVQVHTKESPYADNLLAATGTKALDGTRLGNLAFGFDFARTTPRPGGKLNEYCWFTDGALIAAGLATEEIAPAGELTPLFRFGENTLSSGEAASMVQAVYSDESRTDFTYDVNSNQYYKYIDGAFHTDEDGSHLLFTNLIFLSTSIGTKADSNLYLEYDFSAGSGWYFYGGKMQPIRWMKGAPGDALRLMDTENREISVNPGKSYIGFLPVARADALNWQA